MLAPLKNLRVLRVLRPLRLVARNAGMRLILTSLYKALPAVSNVFGVVLALQLVSGEGIDRVSPVLVASAAVRACRPCFLTAFHRPPMPGVCRLRHAALHGAPCQLLQSGHPNAGRVCRR